MIRTKAVSAAMLALLLATGGARAQQVVPNRTGPGWSADSLVRWFELEASNAPRNTGEVGMARVLFVLRHPEAVPAAKQDSVAQGLERLALRPDAVDAAKLAAVIYLGIGGEGRGGKPLRDAPARLSRIYRQSNALIVRTSVLMTAWTVADRAAMVPLLREVATKAPDPSRPVPSHDDGSDPSVLAVVALSRMGDVGRSTLTSLARSGAVRSPHARARLESLTTPAGNP